MDTIFKMLLAMVGQGLVTAGIALCCWYLLLHQLHKECLRHQDRIRMEQEDRDVD